MLKLDPELTLKQEDAVWWHTHEENQVDQDKLTFDICCKLVTRVPIPTDGAHPKDVHTRARVRTDTHSRCMGVPLRDVGGSESNHTRKLASSSQLEGRCSPGYHCALVHAHDQV